MVTFLAVKRTHLAITGAPGAVQPPLRRLPQCHLDIAGQLCNMVNQVPRRCSAVIGAARWTSGCLASCRTTSRISRSAANPTHSPYGSAARIERQATNNETACPSLTATRPRNHESSRTAQLNTPWPVAESPRAKPSLASIGNYCRTTQRLRRLQHGRIIALS